MKIENIAYKVALTTVREGRNTAGVPSTYVQGKTVKNVGAPPRTFDPVPVQTDAQIDADIIDVMRCELQESEDKVVDLEAQIEERDRTIARLTKSIAKLERAAARG